MTKVALFEGRKQTFSINDPKNSMNGYRGVDEWIPAYFLIRTKVFETEAAVLFSELDEILQFGPECGIF